MVPPVEFNFITYAINVYFILNKTLGRPTKESTDDREDRVNWKGRWEDFNKVDQQSIDNGSNENLIAENKFAPNYLLDNIV